jgi:hypothetical protein
MDILLSTDNTDLGLCNAALQVLFLGNYTFTIRCTVLGGTAGNCFLDTSSEQLSLCLLLYLVSPTEMPSL